MTTRTGDPRNFNNSLHKRCAYLWVRPLGGFHHRVISKELDRVLERRRQRHENGTLTPRAAQLYAEWIADLKTMMRLYP